MNLIAREENHTDLTASQQLIFTGQLLAADSPMYNMAFVFAIEGKIDEDKFGLAFERLIEESDALRATFLVNETGDFEQHIDTQIGYRLEALDFTNYSQTDLDKWCRDKCQERFDLAKRVFYSALLKTSENSFVWFLNVHHIATDALSFPILLERLSSLYTDNKNADELPRYSGYRDFERSKRSPAKIDSSSEQKISRIENDSVAERFIVDLKTKTIENVDRLLRRPEFRALTPQLSRFSFYHAVLACFLDQMTDNSDQIGTPIPNRSTAVLKNTPGLFIEFFPLKLSVEPHDKFVDVFKKSVSETLTLLKNNGPGSASAEKSRRFKYVLNAINVDFGDFAGFPVAAEWIHPGHIDPSHDFRLHVYDDASKEGLQLFFDVKENSFAGLAANKVPAAFVAYLEDILERPESELRLPEAVSAEIPEFSSIPTLFFGCADVFPDRIAVVDRDETRDYSSFSKDVLAFAAFLSECGVTRGDRIALDLPRSVEYLTAVYGAMAIGAVFVPVPVETPLKRKEHIYNDADVFLVVSDDEKVSGDEKHRHVSFPKQLNEAQGFEPVPLNASDTAYILYTSGSTGQPKGVVVSHGNLSNYLTWAQDEYSRKEPDVFAFFTSIGFDLTITSTMLPLISGDTIKVIERTQTDRDLSILELPEDTAITQFKATPSHLRLLNETEFVNSNINTIIVGGEDFPVSLARDTRKRFPNARIVNEYGPTEATVGCIAHTYSDSAKYRKTVPIGKAIRGVEAHLLGVDLKPVAGTGEIFLSGLSIAEGYWNQPELTDERFICDPSDPGRILYRTGDLAELNNSGDFVYLGRSDEQVKVGGFRIEPAEIEAALSSIEGIKSAVVLTDKGIEHGEPESKLNCSRCGLPSNYPGAQFDNEAVCNFCISFERYSEKAMEYFRPESELLDLLSTGKTISESEYDCLVLLSGGKDSTYVLGRIADMGFKPLAFTLDNGYISEQAKGNIERVVDELGIDHVYGSTPAMNAIFVESLKTFSNVCNGCFKTIYTLAAKEACDRKIPFIVTGLSRGQFFETRLTEELFLGPGFDPDLIDRTVLDARKAYHRVDDVVKRELDTSMFDSDEFFETVQFVDFYRYVDETNKGLYKYLDEKLPWVRPTDTGRSTNCLINKAGIAVHRKDRGFSNYAYPYSWDVRMGHKVREEALEEINEQIDDAEVAEILHEIGYLSESSDSTLIAFVESESPKDFETLRNELLEIIPEYMIPARFEFISEFPLNENGKIDRTALIQTKDHDEFVEPKGDIEELVAGIWSDVLGVTKPSSTANFLSLGGQSLEAIRIAARLNSDLETELPPNLVFSNPTIKKLASSIESHLIALIEEDQKGQK